jgi:hypothetical protein
MSPVLRPVGGTVRGDGKDKVDSRIEAALEARRPAPMLSRRDAIYCRPTTDFSRCGIVKAGYIYRVEPAGAVQRHDLAWIGEMQKALVKEKHQADHPRYLVGYPDWSEDLVERCCTAYWNADATAAPVWEFLTPEFVIAEILSNHIIDASRRGLGAIPIAYTVVARASLTA